jgi:peptidoglycan hydrolase FlgJ
MGIPHFCFGWTPVATSPGGTMMLDMLRPADPAGPQGLQDLRGARSAAPADGAEAAACFDLAFGAERRANAAAAAAPSQSGAVLSPEDAAMKDSYRKFEAMVLQNFIKSMLPSDSEEIFGKGTAGDIWKSMMAEQLGTVIAEGGGIGIADRLMADRRLVTSKPDAQTPSA